MRSVTRRCAFGWKCPSGLRFPHERNRLGEFARTVEARGYGALWFTEGLGRESFTVASHLLARTTRLVVATGVAIVYLREPECTVRAAKALAELSGGRFVLGLGVSNARANAARGVSYGTPVTHMRDYLARMRTAAYAAPTPREEPPVVLAALLPRMLALAAAATQGTHTYFMPPTMTARVRAAIGAEKWICAEQAVLLETDAKRARAAARAYMSFYLAIPHYRTALSPLGFDESDFVDGGSDRLVDAVVAWGDAARLRERVAEHRNAGATHVCILPLGSDGSTRPDLRVLDALAPG